MIINSQSNKSNVQVITFACTFYVFLTHITLYDMLIKECPIATLLMGMLPIYCY